MTCDAAAETALPTSITIGRTTYKVEGDRKSITLVGPRNGRMHGMANVHSGDFTVFQGAGTRVFVRLRLTPPAS